ncbi:MAG: VWA domain-containing protein [Planctomycetaceae bacterium]|nr:VWA domain-containing protein [Planctomycetaceae bacterium]
MSAALENLLGLEFQAPLWLWVALLVPLAALLRTLGPRAALPFAPFARLTRTRPTARLHLAPLPTALSAAGLLVLCVALARPVERALLPRTSLGLDVLVALDVSSSMGETDLAPDRTRLHVAREAMVQFAARRGDDRIGLLTFARYPDLAVPLTRDHDAWTQSLAALQPLAPEHGEDATALGLAIAEGAAVLARSALPEVPRGRVLVLVSDGEENVHYPGASREIAPNDGAQVAAALGVRVHTIAVGQNARDSAGNAVPLDTSALRGAAAASGGTFARAGDEGALERSLRAIDELEPSPLAEPQVKLVPRHLAFLVAGAALLVLARCLRVLGLEVLP